jgi:DNA polymerase III delta prime subunit
MSDLKNFISELEKKDSRIGNYFQDKKMLISSLKELDEVIGMRKVKTQIVKQIKTFISTKSQGRYKDKDRKHCLLCGPPGCGKTMVAKVLCKIWIAIGFISGTGGSKKITTFNQLQDELVRKQKKEINEYKKKIAMANKIVMNLQRVSIISRRTLSNTVSIKNNIPGRIYQEMFHDLTGANNIVEESNKVSTELNKVKTENFKGMEVEIEKEMETTREDVDLPFYVYNRNDVISRYVGDTAHRCTKAMNDALGGVAYFDEVYNLCNDSMGFGDSYGREALTVINQYMDTYSDRLIVVFSGYKDEIYNTIFKVQKGLESRFTHKFDIEPYTPEELSQIYIQRLKFSGWDLETSPELVKIFKDNYRLFTYHGRDMDTLAVYTKNVMSERTYSNIIDGQKFPSAITDLEVVRSAVEIFKSNMIKTNSSKNDFERLAEVLRS